MECDTAVISICRFSAEDWDRKGEPNDGDFYLSLEEQKMVSDVCARFDRIVVILNVGPGLLVIQRSAPCCWPGRAAWRGLWRRQISSAVT